MISTVLVEILIIIIIIIVTFIERHTRSYTEALILDGKLIDNRKDISLISMLLLSYTSLTLC